MPHLTLLGAKTSPFTRKIRIILAEKDIPFEYLPETAMGEDNKIIPNNPLGKVPVMIADGEQIFDSRVIVEYLEWLSPSPAMYPKPGMDCIAVKRWEALGDGISDAGGICVKEMRREDKSQEVIDRQTRKFQRSFEKASKDLGENKWCHGNAFSLADIAIGSAIAWIGMRFPDYDWEKRYPNLNALHERLLQRPSFSSTTPPVVRR